MCALLGHSAAQTWVSMVLLGTLCSERGPVKVHFARAHVRQIGRASCRERVEFRRVLFRSCALLGHSAAQTWVSMVLLGTLCSERGPVKVHFARAHVRQLLPPLELKDSPIFLFGSPWA